MKKFQIKFRLSLSLLTALVLFLNPLWAQNPIIGYTYAGSYNGHVYYLSDCTSDWYNAGTAANEMGGYLVSITDMDENNFVQSITPTNGFAWIGLSIQCSVCLWASGEPIQYVNDLYNGSGYFLAIRGTFGLVNDGWWIYFDEGELFRYIIEFDSNPDCNNPNKQYVCHNGNTICVNNSAVQTHLSHGDYLGPCSGCNNPNAFQALNTDPIPPDENNVYSSSATPFEDDNISMKNRSFDIYPNPTSGILQVFIPVSKSPAEIIIRDRFGKVIWTSKMANPTQALEIHLNSINVSPGIYFISFIAEGVLQTKRFVVSK